MERLTCTDVRVRAEVWRSTVRSQGKTGRSSIPVDLELIKSYLPARKPLGEMVVQLKDTISKTLLLKELNIDPKLIERISKTLQLLLPQGERVPDAAQIREQIGLSGINYESKIRNILMDGALSKAGNPALSEDLKGQLLLLQS